jgi:hypothetical protein
MTLLDRFRTQTRHNHPDTAVRLAYIAELPLDERDLIVAVAREDEDARVRCAAVAKLMDPSALAAVALDDADEHVRAQAIAMLRDIALDAFEGVSVAEALAAVDALRDTKTLAQIAKTSPREEVARRALARVDDVHAFGSIARRAVLEPIRRAAFDGLQDRGELLGVAMNGEFKDTAVAAVERLVDRAQLEQVAARGNNKSAAKRARGVLRELDERAAQEAVAAAPRVPDPAATAHDEPVEVAPPPEALARVEDLRAVETALKEAEAARLRDEQQAERARAAAAKQAREEAREQARKEARKEAERTAERRRVRLAELADEAESAATDADLASARRRMAVAHREWTDLGTGGAIDPEVESRLAGAEARLTARETELHEADARARREALNRLHQLLARVEQLTTADLSLKAAERALRDVRAALSDVPPLPSKRDYEEAIRRLRAALASLTTKVQELREVAGWQRWANVGIQEQLCEKMEALGTADDAEDIARQIRELQQQWRQAADVPRAQGEALWRRFKTAHDEVWGRCEAHFAAQAQVRAENLAKKVAFVERAEALADSTNWISAAEEIKRLQAEWKTVGPVTRGQEKAAWERFRAACDRFFTRRQEDLAKRKIIWAENLARKEALSARAEALGESTEWEAAAAEIKRLQSEWRTIGPVKKSRSEALWQRFRGACDRFFTRYAQRHDIARAERVAAREAVCAALEALAPGAGAVEPPPDARSQEPPAASPVEPPADLLQSVHALRLRWQQELAARGVDRERAFALDERFAAAFNRVVAGWPAVFDGTDLDPDANTKRMEALARRMEDLAASLGGAVPAVAALSPTTRLAAMLKEALATNTIGGKVDEESRWRAAQEDVRQAQASWSRIGPVADEARRRALIDRFQSACRRIAEGAAKAGAAAKAVVAGKAGVAGVAGGSSRPTGS